MLYEIGNLYNNRQTVILEEKDLKKIFTEGWFKKLKPFLTSEDFDSILRFVDLEEVLGKIIYPEKKNIFRAFRETPLEALKVVWLGQDP